MSITSIEPGHPEELVGFWELYTDDDRKADPADR
jgi:hypothetical protein